MIAEAVRVRELQGGGSLNSDAGWAYVRQLGGGGGLGDEASLYR